MALVFGSGEPVSRLRRALDVKGKLALAVDEIIVPVLTIFDATRPPFRKTGIRWFADVLASGGVGTMGRVRIINPTNIDQLIDGFIFSVTAGGTPPALQFFVGAGPAGAAGGVPVRTTEIVVADAGGVPSRQLPITTLVDAITPTSLSQRFYSVVGDTSGEGSVILPVEIVMPGSKKNTPATNTTAITVEISATDQPFTLSVTGLYWDALPLDALT